MAAILYGILDNHWDARDQEIDGFGISRNDLKTTKTNPMQDSNDRL